MDQKEQIKSQPLTEHLAELRSCLIIALVAVGVGFGIAYNYILPISEWFFQPLMKVLPKGQYLIYNSISGGLFFYLKLALVCGVLIGSPVVFLQIWRFVAPGLYRHEKKVLLPFTTISTFCFLGGAAFGYFVIFPPAFKFLTGYGNETLSPLPDVEDYFDLALWLLISFGMIFELPVFAVFLAKIGVMDAAFLQRNRKYSILISFIIAAIITPTPDVINQCFLAVPLIILYEISILAVRLFGGKTFADFAKPGEST